MVRNLSLKSFSWISALNPSLPFFRVIATAAQQLYPSFAGHVETLVGCCCSGTWTLAGAALGTALLSSTPVCLAAGTTAGLDVTFAYIKLSTPPTHNESLHPCRPFPTSDLLCHRLLQELPEEMPFHLSQIHLEMPIFTRCKNKHLEF